MSKERLEEIVKQVKRSGEYAGKGLWEASDEMIIHLHNEGHINYLIEQAEQNKRYREAIEFGIEYLKNSDIRQVQLVVTALKSALEESE